MPKVTIRYTQAELEQLLAQYLLEKQGLAVAVRLQASVTGDDRNQGTHTEIWATAETFEAVPSTVQDNKGAR